MIKDDTLETVHSESTPLCVSRIRHPIGVQHDEVSGLEMYCALLKRRVRHHAQHHSRRPQLRQPLMVGPT